MLDVRKKVLHPLNVYHNSIYANMCTERTILLKCLKI